MKPWKLMAALIMTLGLCAGMTANCYAQEKELASGDKAEGIWNSDKREGPGRTYYKDGNVLEGFYVHDSLEGPVTVYGTDGTRHIYTCFDNKANGLALKIFKDGDITPLFFEDGNVNKDVVLQSWELIDGTHYYARKKTDINAGKAIAVYTNGDIYIGDFKDGKRNGWGSCFYSNGRTHTGEWKDDMRDGVGFLLFPQDSSALFTEGFWVKDKGNGLLCQYEKEGAMLVAVNKNGLTDGPGVYIKPDKSLAFCEYTAGKITNKEPAVYTDESGNQFLGIADGKNGFGLKVTKKGNIFIGNFKDGLASGETHVCWTDLQTLFQGTYKDGKRTEGTILWLQGTYYRGTFRTDEQSSFDHGAKRSFKTYTEGTFTDESKLNTGTLTSFNKDGSSATKKYKDGKEQD